MARLFDMWSRSGVGEKMLKDRQQEESHNTHSNNNDFCMKPLVKDTCALSVTCVLQGPVTCHNASFTDLAEIVSRIELAKPALVDGETGTLSYQHIEQQSAVEVMEVKQASEAGKRLRASS
ncbi:unnamed protein product [Coregonus sp. 'balchen']|nr:unnamed protein product [Coregonus sp. 'balchen']